MIIQLALIYYKFSTLHQGLVSKIKQNKSNKDDNFHEFGKAFFNSNLLLQLTNANFSHPSKAQIKGKPLSKSVFCIIVSYRVASLLKSVGLVRRIKEKERKREKEFVIFG